MIFFSNVELIGLLMSFCLGNPTKKGIDANKLMVISNIEWNQTQLYVLLNVDEEHPFLEKNKKIL